MDFKRYVCKVCGHIYDEAVGDPIIGIAPGTRFEDLPEHWFCALCGEPREEFELMEGPYPESVIAPGVLPDTDSQPIVIIGAGLAGWYAAERLRRMNAQQPITLVSADSADFYYKPNMSVALSKGIAAEKMVLTAGADKAAQLAVELKAGHKVLGLDIDKKKVLTDKGTVEYSSLVLATGAAPIKPKFASKRSGVLHLNDLADYSKFRDALPAKGGHVTLIGGGLIGCEFAEDLAVSGYKVSVVDIASRLLSRLTPEPVAQMVQQKLVDQGVEFLMESEVSKVAKADGGFQVTFADGQVLQSDMVISAIGLAPNAKLAAKCGITTAKGIVVDTQMRTSVEDIYALGDCAEVDGNVYNYVESIGRQADALADALLGSGDNVFKTRFPCVKLKSTLCPVSVFKPDLRREDGDWVVLEQDEAGLVLEYWQDCERVGYAVCGDREESAVQLHESVNKVGMADMHVA